MRRLIKLGLGSLLLLELIWVPTSSTEATAQSQVSEIPNVYRGCWFQPEILKYWVKMTATTFTFGGGYYEQKHWQPIKQQTYRLSDQVTAGTFTWSRSTNTQGYHTIKVRGGAYHVKVSQGTLFVKQIRQGHDINGYELTFNQIPHAAQVLSGDVH